ncbi:MAG: SecDF P1 head subdomain-containing protein, partial [Alphaproteobacteria bacterium]
PVWKIWLVAGICALGVLFAAPNLLPRDVAESLPGWMPNQQIALGLDLSGGAHLLLEIDEDVYISDRLMTMESDIRRILRTERIGVRVLGTQDMTVNFALRDAADVEAVRVELSGIGEGFLIVVNDDGTMTVSMTEQGLTSGLSDAIERTIEVLAKRIDPNGVLEPIITRQGRDRILVQVPGLDNTEELKGRLGETAKLTFHLVDDEASLSGALEGNLPLGSVLMPGAEGSGAESYVLRSEVLVSGENLADAASSFDQSGNPAVSFSFDSIGASRFCEVTT